MRFVPFALLAAACSSPVALHDQYDDSIGNLFGGPEDRVSAPYQVGVTFEMEIVGRDGVVADLDLVSSDPDVLTVVSMRTDTNGDSIQRIATLQTVADGTVDLDVRQQERTRHTLSIDVMTPDRIELAPVQTLIAESQENNPEAAEPLTRMDVWAAGEAEFELRPMAGEQQLAGAVFPTYTLTDGRADAETYRTDDEFDVVRISPAEGPATLTIETPSQRFTVDVEGHVTIGELGLRCLEDAALAESLGGYGCLATAQTPSGAPLFGVFPEWLEVQEDGTTAPFDSELPVEADILTYQLAGEANGEGPEIRVQAGGQSASRRALGPIDSVAFDNSNTLTACSAVSPMALWLAGPALLLLGLRRRRR